MLSAGSTAASIRRFQLWRIFQWLILSVLLMVAADALFQFSRMQWENHRYPPRGKLVDIGGVRLHVHCTGAGSPTVVMENGSNDSSVIWQLVQPAVSKSTRVCSYDRAGFGWSDVNVYYHLMPWTVPLGVPHVLGWCRYTLPNQPQQWDRFAPEATAQYCRLRAWRTEHASDRRGWIDAR